MKRRIPADKVEAYIGATRHATDHIGRADHAIQQLAILHSAECLARIEREGLDLLDDCPFSQALDRGVVEASWPDLTPLPMALDADGRVVPREAAKEAVTEPETMRWQTHMGRVALSEWGLSFRAMQIAKWINRWGGEARYEPAQHERLGDPVPYQPARIVIAGPSGPVVMHPGDEAVKGDWFELDRYPRPDRSVREFTVRPASPEGAS